MSEEAEGIVAVLTKTIKENWRLLAVGIIILAIALNSSLSTNKPYSNNKEGDKKTEQTNQEKQKPNTENNAENSNEKKNENNIINAAQAQGTQTASTDAIVQTASKSEGVTHLARRAVKEYLNSAQENLSAEQKIYAEDYLKKRIGAKTLKIGEKVEFKTDTIKQGIEKAKALNENQIKNLSKFVPLAKNLN